MPDATTMTTAAAPPTPPPRSPLFFFLQSHGSHAVTEHPPLPRRRRGHRCRHRRHPYRCCCRRRHSESGHSSRSGYPPSGPPGTPTTPASTPYARSTVESPAAPGCTGLSPPKTSGRSASCCAPPTRGGAPGRWATGMPTAARPTAAAACRGGAARVCASHRAARRRRRWSGRWPRRPRPPRRCRRPGRRAGGGGRTTKGGGCGGEGDKRELAMVVRRRWSWETSLRRRALEGGRTDDPEGPRWRFAYIFLRTKINFQMFCALFFTNPLPGHTSRLPWNVAARPLQSCWTQQLASAIPCGRVMGWWGARGSGQAALLSENPFSGGSGGGGGPSPPTISVRIPPVVGSVRPPRVHTHSAHTLAGSSYIR